MQQMNFRKYNEELELRTLSFYAAKSCETKGREREIEPCPMRTDFVRDRDRIIHCKSFRRLKHKTQVFLSPAGDHYRTRLTHTLEVSQIARTIARGLRFNEDLTEAIALGHDLGHTPFGHAGEAALDALVPGGFSHHEQSLRVVEKLENGTGLNLTFEVRDGIVNHRSKGNPATLEGAVVSVADRIAYINHDIDDAVRAGVLSVDDLPESCNNFLGRSHGQRINTLVYDILKTSFDKPYVAMSEVVENEFNILRNFMFDSVYTNPKAKSEEGKVRDMVAQLYKYYALNTDKMSDEFTKNIQIFGSERVAADYIACMTDRYAIADYERLFIPKGWL